MRLQLTVRDGSRTYNCLASNFEHCINASNIPVSTVYETSANKGNKTTKGRPTWLDVEVVCSEDDLKEHLLVDVDELLVPVGDLCRLFARVVCIFREGFWVFAVVLAPFEDLRDKRKRAG